MELQDAVGEALKGSKMDFRGLGSVLGDGGIENVLDGDIGELSGPIESIIGMVLSVVTSRRVKNALFKCAEKALMGEDKINRDFFDAVENREFYYPIMTEVIKVNLGPFFKSLGSLFGGPGNLLSNFLKSK
jgi:hypothetical protein